MEINIVICYNKGYETFREPDAIGEATPTSDPVAKEGQDIVGSSTDSWFLSKLSIPMARGLSKGRGERVKCPSGAGASSQAFGEKEEIPCEAFNKRPFGFWLQHRPLDHPTCRRGNSQVSPSSLSPQSYLASVNRVRMELSEAGAQGTGEERGRDRTLEEETVAGNKKKPSNLGPIWPFSMKVGFCLFLMFAGHGLRGGKLPSCIISISEKGFRPSRPLPSRPSSDTWDFTSDFKERISRPWTWQSFCIISCNTSVVISSFYGTKLSSTGENPFMTSAIVIQGSMWNGSLDTLLSLTRWSLYGHRRSVDWPIVPLKGQRNSSECCVLPRDASNILNISSGLAYGPLNCLGKDNMFSINYA